MSKRLVRCYCVSGRTGPPIQSAIIRGADAIDFYSFAFNCFSFVAIKARMSDDISNSLSHCSLYKVTGKRPMP